MTRRRALVFSSATVSQIVALGVGLALVVVALRGGMPSDRVNPATPGTGFTDLLGVPAATFVALVSWVLVWRNYRQLTFSAVIAVIPALAVLSLMHSQVVWASLVGCMVLAGASATGASTAVCARSGRALNVVVYALILASAVVAALGIREYAGEVALHNPTWRVFSTFATPNFLAGYLCMTVPLAAAAFLATGDRMVALLAGFSLALETSALLLTGSRFGLVCLVVGLTVFGSYAVRAGALRGRTRRRTLALMLVAVLALAAGVRPVLHRLANTGLESYSTQFREYTWRGALRMALAHPIFGTGIGSFDAAYPRYALVGYTEHAHNSYLQLADEIGIPGAVLFTAWVAVLLVKTLKTDWRRYQAASVPGPPSVRAARGPAPNAHQSRPPGAGGSGVTLDLEILKAGVVGGLAGALLRNCFDSDLYVPANAFTFAVLCGVMAGFAGWRPAATVSIVLRWIGIAASACAAVFCVMVAGGRVEALRGMGLLRSADAFGAAQYLSAAAAWDPLNPDYRLSLAEVYEMQGDLHSAGEQYQAAIRLADIGKCHYRYARFLERAHDLPGAIGQFERARTLEPLNLQNLLALAEVYEADGRRAAAELVYRQIAALYRAPVGRVRALPELVNWEFGAAYAALGRYEAAAGDPKRAEADYRQAVQILEEYWQRRNLQIVQVEVRPEVLRSVADRYRAALQGWEHSLRALGRTEEASAAAAMRARLERELAAQNRAQFP
ncbi:MAG: O-antigen ligase family protein [Chthonomonadales bacterium]